MKRFLYIATLLVLLSACTADVEDRDVIVGGENQHDKIVNGSNGCVHGTILVRFDASAESRLAKCATRSGATRTGVVGVDSILDELNGYAVEPLFIVTEKNKDKVYADGLHLWYELRFDEECNMDKVATRFADIAEVATVQFVHKIARIGNPQVVNDSSAQLLQASRALTIEGVFDDTYNHYQWGLDNLGDKSKVSCNKNIKDLAEPNVEADINAMPAWKLCKGDPSIIVAVMDEGVMHSHEDLADNMWINNAELNGTADVDDDGNGYKDDIYGFNFVTMKGEITWSKSGDTGHGSHVAGIVSAVNNNGIGVSSVAGGSGNKDGVKLMSIQIFSGNSGITTTNMTRSMQYAADNGAHIMQCSWGYLSAASDNGWGMPGNDKQFKRTCAAEAAAIDYFIKNAGSAEGPLEGGLVIFAAGNDGAPLPSYPAAYEPCVAVAAMSPGLRPTFFSDHGIGTDIMAPGGESLYNYGEILSTVPEMFASNGTKCYAMMQGTSQACPHVSGVAALGLSYAKQLGKRYTAKEFRSMLISAANDIDPHLVGSISFQDVSGRRYSVNYPDYKGMLGNGYIDAYKFLLKIDGTPCKVIKVGEESEIDLSLYFGEGISHAQFSKTEYSEEEAASVGFSSAGYSDGKLKVTCTKSGVITLSVTMLVGGGSLSNSSQPYPTEVTRTFVVIAKEGVNTNGGWL